MSDIILNKQDTNTNPLVYIIVLNWNGLKWLKRCIPSIEQNTIYTNYQIILVDNNSTDRSVEWIEKEHDDIHIIKNNKNYGFAKGVNIGARYAIKSLADYVVVLNTDIKVKKGWLESMVMVGESSKEIGFIGPQIFDYNGEKKIFAYKNIEEKEGYNIVERIDGCGFAVKAVVIKEIGYIDEKYFMYWEEVDWQRRAKFFGYSVVVALDSVIYHSVKGSEKIKIKTWYLYARNRIYYMLKDPNRTFFNNIKATYGDVKMQKDNFVKRKEYIRILMIPLGLAWNLFHLPYTWMKRNKEFGRDKLK